jgi:glutathione S-transferase
MITLYGSGQSRSFRALWALEEAGVEYSYAAVSVGSQDENGTRTPEYLKMNSQGKVPTLVDDDLVLTESASIVNYIGNLVPQENFVPQNAKEKALYDQVMFFVMSDLEQPLWTNGKHRFAIPEEHRIPGILPTTHWEFAKSLKALDALRGSNEYICSAHFTFADIMVTQTLNWAERFEYDVPATWKAYANKIQERTAFKRALEKLA